MYVYIYIYIYICIYMCIYTHAYIHVYVYMLSLRTPGLWTGRGGLEHQRRAVCAARVATAFTRIYVYMYIYVYI